MSPEEKVGQLFMIWVRAEFLNVDNPEYIQLRDTIRKYHIGLPRDDGPLRKGHFSIRTSLTKPRRC